MSGTTEAAPVFAFVAPVMFVLLFGSALLATTGTVCGTLADGLGKSHRLRALAHEHRNCPNSEFRPARWRI
ncbi:MAG TPA: hypothetical protein VNC17_08715 [Thermoleophilaceae bacterium]|nr:hypothetical protein [Thermoleophilaceae bacterium]